ncbi:hydroxymethylpyrimidine/phosphomethylpyrimidine kinase [Tistlia consotensis]|uniref:hydroxymethylpyrimidine kinase n=1 Tax=Tistlia consotensis USBA 355 TaxID=560819 RepID=A0A1Y6BX79_9PROT|nr:bifunctional hydroxymethylpyrimidine kinase/phosphomethylpyrimidine kinase [Tistlia consotensis]SMF32607.1 hydroxymethylpyrimidine/phosphomethylpyrimidine kinase [Tistlia consotensis USBA 355]SNR68686.1 hydroxymethylpyrimidine/phosphomethylpyrimidine kinase [Tistlia consotensis]
MTDARSTQRGRVLIVAGSDSGGGAGIQADIKAVTALGGYAMTAITALTAQNTLGVEGVVGIEPAFIRQQIAVVLDDLGADAIKTGMLHSAPVIEAVAAELELRGRGIPLVVDPVMVAESGASLLDPTAVGALNRDLLVRATLLTPNLPEAEKLTGMTIADLEAMRQAASMLRTLGAESVLLKGGHLVGDTIHDVLATEAGLEVFTDTRLPARGSHGTGCTLASAVACGLAQGLGLRDAVLRARAYLREAIRTAPGLGRGNGPVNHGHTVRDFPVPR